MFVRGTTRLFVLLAVLQSVSFGDRVRVELQGVVEPKGELIRVADIASLSGGDLLTRRKIAKLDVVLMGEDTEASRGITKRLVELRIQLSGISSDQFMVVGPENILLKSRPMQSNEARLLRLLRPRIADRLGVAEDDVSIRLSRPLLEDAGNFITSGSDVDFFLPARINSGSVTVKVGIYKNGNLIRTAAVWLDVDVSRDVWVAQRDIESGESLSAGDVKRERRQLHQQPVATEVVGRQVRRTIRKGTIVSKSDLLRSPAKKNQIVVRNRDIVEVVARRNSLRIRISGVMALQQGAVGDSIRVKNPRSGKVLTAKVVEAGSVEIRL